MNATALLNPLSLVVVVVFEDDEERSMERNRCCSSTHATCPKHCGLTEHCKRTESSNGGSSTSVIITRRTKSYSSPGNVLFGTVTHSRNVNVG